MKRVDKIKCKFVNPKNVEGGTDSAPPLRPFFVISLPVVIFRADNFLTFFLQALRSI